jgi:hypothetical protein
MVLLAHGAVGGWDELAVAVVGFVVLWVAVKLAGRKPATGDGEVSDGDAEATHAEPETLSSAAPRP